MNYSKENANNCLIECKRLLDNGVLPSWDELPEIDLYMDSFIEDGFSIDIYDFKFRNTAILDYDVEDRLSNIKAKTLIFSASEDIYYTPEFDTYPLKDKIENIEISIFDAQNFVYNEDYSKFIDPFREFLEEFKK